MLGVSFNQTVVYSLQILTNALTEMVAAAITALTFQERFTVDALRGYL